MTHRIVNESPIGVVVVRKGGNGSDGPFQRILIPVDGSRFSRFAAEVAFAYAGATGAEATVLHVAHEQRMTSGSIPVPSRREAQPLAGAGTRAREIRRQIEEGLGPVAAPQGARMQIRILTSGSPGDTIIHESHTGHYDLLILGSENKMLGRPLFSGQGTAEIVERAGCTTAVVLWGSP